MKTTIENEWITLSEKRNGVVVQRKAGGIDPLINVDDTVEYCKVYYWERELYPNGEVIKTERKWYTLEDLAYTEITIDNVVYAMQPLAVLTGFIQSLGKPYIIDPCRDTLENITILPLDVENGYPLRRDTRPLITI